MNIYEQLRQKPFSLDDEQMSWVQDTFAGMDTHDKVGQLFCLAARSSLEEWVDGVFDICNPGGFMYRPMTMDEALDYTKMLDRKSKIPMLIAADVEKGGNVITDKGTLFGSPMAIAASDDIENARRLGEICATEIAAVGGNWAFAPIIDIDYNWRNPITNIRTFGSDPAKVRDYGRAYVESAQSHGVAASIKHFPGDGRDERDQHIVTTINDMSCEDWMGTYGAAYKASIDAGAMTVMVGHIMQPAWSRRLCPGIKDEDILPATLAPELMNGLLRGILGFNGLIVTDATTMVGFNAAMSRKRSVPLSIAAGADMFLFSKNFPEDYQFMLDGIADGTITEERLNEAVLRILGLKAALRLYNRPMPNREDALKVIGNKQHKEWVKNCMDKAVTLVKEEKGVLPLTAERYPRILVYPVEKENGVPCYNENGPCGIFVRKLEKEGFQVSIFTPTEGTEGRFLPTSNFVDKYDAIVYIANIPTQSNQTQVRIEWASPIGANCPIYFHDLPTVFVSVENPYHLIDAPRVKTYINAYCATEESISAVIEKLTGRSPFTGVSPVDPFCGKWDTRL